MAKKKRSGLDDPEFSITQPMANGSLMVNSDGTLTINVTGTATFSYTATIFSYTQGTGIGGQLDSGGMGLAGDGSDPTKFTKDLDPGAVSTSATNNMVVQVTGNTSGDIDGFPFIAVPGGSNEQAARKKRRKKERCPNCDPSQPVPVSLLLKLDSKVTAGECEACAKLNKPTTLVHGKEAEHSCSWYSQPIDFCSDSKPGVWMLEKTSSRNWKLTLQRGKAAVVAYALKTKNAKDCSFPLKLKLAGKTTKKCKKWPKTVTIVPAP